MIHQLKNDGLSISGIARRLNLHRKTVRRYLSSKPGDTARVPRKARSSTLDRYRGHLRRWVTEHPQLCATRLLCEIMAQGYIGCILILRDYLRQILPGHPKTTTCVGMALVMSLLAMPGAPQKFGVFKHPD